MQAQLAAQQIVPTAKMEPEKVFANATTEAEKLIKNHPLLSEVISATIGCADPEIAISSLTETIHYLDEVYDGSLHQVNYDAPSEVIEQVWGILLLFTRPYHDFCYERYGKIIHNEAMLTESLNKTVGILISLLGMENPVFRNTSTS